MANCDNKSAAPSNVCSGKCKGDSCALKTNVWVLAICEGAAALYEKENTGNIVPVTDGGSNLFSFSAEFYKMMLKYAEQEKFQQLVLVGSSKDIVWAQAALPENISRKVVAEIIYPLLLAWFSKSNISKLTQALNNVFSN